LIPLYTFKASTAPRSASRPVIWRPTRKNRPVGPCRSTSWNRSSRSIRFPASARRRSGPSRPCPKRRKSVL